jgi:hypothetical protein
MEIPTLQESLLFNLFFYLERMFFMLINMAAKIFQKSLKYDKDGTPIGTSWLGNTIFGGIAGTVALARGYEENSKLNMGTSDGKIYGNTPGYQNYLQMKPQRHNPLHAPAGADGNLVFALHNTRNGGFL